MNIYQSFTFLFFCVNYFILFCSTTNVKVDTETSKASLVIGARNATYSSFCETRERLQRVAAQENAEVTILFYTSTLIQLAMGRVDVQTECVASRDQCPHTDALTAPVDDGFAENYSHLICKDRERPFACRPIVPPLDTEASTRVARAQTNTCTRWKASSTPCRVLPPGAMFDTEQLLNADVVVFDGVNTVGRSTDRFPRQKCASQHWAFYDWRSVVNYPAFGMREFMDNFDVSVGYSRNYTLFAYDMIGSTATIYRADMSVPRDDDVPLAFFISNCRAKNDRLTYIERLVSVVPYHSYGKCMHNRDVPDEARTVNKYTEKRAVLQKYKFALAFENAIDPDYVTEKLWNALEAGAIPVYMGAPNVDEYVPHANAIINADDFESPEALGAYLMRVHTDERLYAKHHAWRSLPRPPLMDHIDQNVRGFAHCMLCKHYADWRRNRYANEALDEENGGDEHSDL